MKKICFFAATTLIFAAWLQIASAQEFRVKTTTVLVGAAPDSPYVVYAKLAAQRFNARLEFKGAGNGMQGAQYLANEAPRDGSVVGIMPMYSAMPVFKGEGVDWNFDPRSLIPLGSATIGTRVCIVASRTGVRTPDDLRTSHLTLGTIAASAFDQHANMVKHGLGANFRLVPYRFLSQIVLAMQRPDPEVDGLCGVEWSGIASGHVVGAEWLRSSEARVILQVAPTERGNVLPGFGGVPDREVPDIRRYVSASEIACVDYVALEEWAGRPFFAPPHVPDDIAARLQKQLWQLFNEPSFKAAVPTHPISAQEVQGVINKAYGAPAAIVACATKLVSP